MADLDDLRDGADFGLDKPVEQSGYFMKGCDNNSWGFKDRMSRIFRPDTGRSVMLAFDHGFIMGPTSGVERIDLSILPLAPHADCLMAARGVIKSCIPPTYNKPICLRSDAGTSILTELNHNVTMDVQNAVALNASAMAIMLSIGDKSTEAKTISNLYKLVDQAEKFGMPVMGVTAVGKDMARDARYFGLASRICAENGASIVKTYYTEGFENVVACCPVPIVIAGGKKLPELEALELCYKAIQCGAAGVDMGRNVFQSENPVAMIQAVSGVVHDGLSPEEGFEKFNDLKSAEVKRETGLNALKLGIVVAVTACGALTQGAEKRPNILFILADDQSPFDLKMYNPKSTLDTPVLDQVAAEGMIFDGAHHMGSFSGAVCNPSRHMIMTGRTVWHLPNAKKVMPKRMCPDDIVDQTMAAVFNRAGYDTMRTCKKGNSYGAANQQFTVVHDSTKRGGTDETGSAWHAKQVLEYLDQRQASNDQDPFLIYYGFSHPHDTRDGKPELLRKYGATNHKDPNTLPVLNPERPAPALPSNYLPAHPFHHGHLKLRDEERVSGVWKNRDEATVRNEIGREYACSENIDIQIGQVLAKLEAMGELDNTYIFYTADHGMSIGRHGLMGKQNLYEHTWRVPYIVKGPGIKAGSRATGNIYLLDTLRTICDLTGVDVADATEGISFKPVLEGKQDVVRDVLYGVYCGGSKPGMRCVKKGDWKLIKYDLLNGTVRETQLFNLADNPDEFLREHKGLANAKPKSKQVNLAGDSKYSRQLKKMEALLLSEQRRLNDPFRLWDQPKE